MPKPVSRAAPKAADDTKRQLVAAALALFAKHGIEPVQVSRIRARTGAGNRSVVHYHFESKNGLIAAVLDSIESRLRPLQEEALAELALVRRAGRPSVRDIVGIGFSPYVMLHQADEAGRQAIQLLARLPAESDPKANALLVRTIEPYFSRLLEMLAAELPDKAPDRLRFHVYLAASQLLHGLADLSTLRQDAVFDFGRTLSERPVVLLEQFFDYISAGLCC